METSMPMQVPNSRQNEVDGEIESLAGSIANLHGLVNELLSRLGPVQHNEPDSPEKALEPVGPPITTPVAMSLRSMSEEITSIVRKVLYHTNRLEI